MEPTISIRVVLKEALANTCATEGQLSAFVYAVVGNVGYSDGMISADKLKQIVERAGSTTGPSPEKIAFLAKCGVLPPAKRHVITIEVEELPTAGQDINHATMTRRIERNAALHLDHSYRNRTGYGYDTLKHDYIVNPKLVRIVSVSAEEKK